MQNSIGIKPTKSPNVALFDDKNVFHSFGYEVNVHISDEKTDEIFH